MKLISKFEALTKYEKYALITIIIAIIIRFSLIGAYAVSGDACWHFSVSKFISENGKIPSFEPLGRDEPFWAPPLFHFISSVFYAAFGEFGLKLIAPIFGSLALIISYLILRMFLSHKASFYGILFLSFLPISIDYSILGYVESMLTFFIVLSLYFALSNKFLLSGIAAGLAILTKYNGAFVIPVLLYIAFRKRKSFLRNSLLIIIIPGLISLPWLIRNWILLGNPIWPFLNFIFNGTEVKSYSGFNISSLFSMNTYLATYFGFFGMPNGNYNTLFFVNVPNIEILFGLFLIGTLIFIVPLFFGFRKHKGSGIFYALLGSFLALFMLYVANVGSLVSRMLLPAVLALAFFYGSGMESINIRYGNFGRLLLVFVVVISAGFVFAEITKFRIASDSWNSYKKDFEWAKSNTGKDAVFIAGGQCISYYISRASLFPSETSSGRYDYVWVNQGFKLDKRAILNDEQLKVLKSKDKDLVYSNDRTKTKIYKIRQ